MRCFAKILFLFVLCFFTIASSSAFEIDKREKCYLLVKEAHKYLKAAEPELAIPILKQALEIDPTSLQAHCKMADALCSSGKFQQSIDECNKALVLDKNSFEAYHRCALAKASLKHYEDALKDANRAITLNPRKAKFFQTRADIFNALKRTNEAVADIHKYLALTPRNDSSVATSYFQTASLYRKAGNPVQERAELSKLISIDRNCVDAYRMRGDSFLVSENRSAAAIDYRRAVELEPDNEHCREFLLKAEKRN